MHLRITVALAACGIVALGVLAACAPQQNDGSASEDASTESTQVAFTWSYDSTCTQCHEKEATSMDDTACLAATHAAEGTTCATCHTDENGLASAHENATPDEAKKRATKLRSTTIDEGACLSCHGSYEELATKTADLTLLTDSEGTTVNPHAMPENEDHADTDCASCHIMHSEEPSTETAPEYCDSCHHAGVYSCHTCHD